MHPHPHRLTTADSSPLKRASSPSLLISRELPWLSWWQELIVNWVASWHAVGELHITSADGEDICSYDLPSDLELERLALEELLRQ